MKKRALISVSDKTGIVRFAERLLANGYEIISTGGTYELLKAPGVLSISEVTGFPEVLDGRVKTLHPGIHGGILAVRDNKEHMNTIKELGINPIDLVVVNLYPFRDVLLKPGATEDELIENIDIGGPAMLRSAAKNHKHVAVVVDPLDYEGILTEVKSGGIGASTKKTLAAKAFRHTAAYDALIAGSLSEDDFDEKLTLTYDLKQKLRYGENPHQRAALYSLPVNAPSIVSAKQLHGKEMSFNNIADADAALEIASEFNEPVSVAVKHKNPCGVGIGKSISEAIQNTIDADPVSIFGGIVAVNRELDECGAKLLSEIFLEVIVAPSYTKEAIELLNRKKNVRLIESAMITKNEGKDKKNNFIPDKQKHISSINGGILVQDADYFGFDQNALAFPTIRQPTKNELTLSKFAWTVVKYLKSNGVLIARDNMTVGIGPGQTNRVGAARIATQQAGERAIGAVMASDGFFPMPDTVFEASKAGIGIIIQPGGSIKDSESIDACNSLGIGMILTGKRHFRH